MAETIAAKDYELYEDLIRWGSLEPRVILELLHFNPEFAEWYRERAKERFQRKGAQR
jgi:hypothetical protein